MMSFVQLAPLSSDICLLTDLDKKGVDSVLVKHAPYIEARFVSALKYITKVVHWGVEDKIYIFIVLTYCYDYCLTALGFTAFV